LFDLLARPQTNDPGVADLGGKPARPGRARQRPHVMVRARACAAPLTPREGAAGRAAWPKHGYGGGAFDITAPPPSRFDKNPAKKKLSLNFKKS